MKKKTGKFAGKRNYKSIVMLSSLILLVSIAVGATVAFLVDSTKAVENTFTPATVDIIIEETFDGAAKSNVVVRNKLVDGKGVKAYIRAQVIINWVDEKGNILPGIPEGATETVTYGSDWQEIDGYYYYKGIVEPDKATTNLINSATYTVSKDVTDRLQIDILAEGIQAVPDNAVAESWKMTYNAETQKWSAVSGS